MIDGMLYAEIRGALPSPPLISFFTHPPPRTASETPPISHPDERGHFDLAIKVYPDGK